MLAITTYCTKSYAYALHAQIPLTVAALRYAVVTKAIFILAGDDSPEVSAAYDAYESAMTECNIVSVRITMPIPDNGNLPHVRRSNLVIARMQAAAWHAARMRGATLLWSLESDILPQPKVLRVMMDTLNFDRGWYDVAMCTYPNQAFLGGRGTPRNWIAPSVYPDEKELSKKLQRRVNAKQRREVQLRKLKQSPSEEEMEEWRSIAAAIEASPPKANVYGLNATRWRARGWLDHAYPGIGQGAILPTDWVGLGCTLMNQRALDLAQFIGFEGGCTQDLWLCWKAWQPAQLRMSVIPHALCSHVKMDHGKLADSLHGPPFARHVIMHAYHELGGEFDGHLRSEIRDWCGL